MGNTDFDYSFNTRNSWLDFFKGIAIAAVVFYHIGWLEYGYLGVDLFFVINGYLICKGIMKKLKADNFSFIAFVKKRVIRLWLLVIIAGMISLIIGYFVMLPDDYENLAQSVVASNFFANNILARITTGNYWDVVQQYKPLMHFWYLGVIMQFYLLIAILVVTSKTMGRGQKDKTSKIFQSSITILTIVSFILYIFIGSAADKFYYLPFRFWELGAGCLINFLHSREKNDKYLLYVLMISVCVLFCGNTNVLQSILLIIIVMISIDLIMVSTKYYYKDDYFSKTFLFRMVSNLGISSYSIFVWHQIILAFYKYSINSTMNLMDYCLYFLILFIVVGISYYFLENRFNKIKRKREKTILVCTVTLCMITTGCSLLLYKNAGVVRDVPELSIYTDNVHRGMHAEYNDRLYSYNHEFSNDGRIKVLIIGDSFGRDWGNVLLESDIAEKLDISYIFSSDISKKCSNRISQADYVFLLASPRANGHDFPSYVYNSINGNAQVYGIGTKGYGQSNGNLYAKRYDDDYLNQTVSYEDVEDIYQKEKTVWGENYIDFINPVLEKNGQVRAFTDDGKYISQDCRHLTKDGARYYARIMNLHELFGIL